MQVFHVKSFYLFTEGILTSLKLQCLLQLAEDLGALPIWVINNGILILTAQISFLMMIPLYVPFLHFFSLLLFFSFTGVSHNDQVHPSTVLPFVQASLELC